MNDQNYEINPKFYELDEDDYNEFIKKTKFITEGHDLELNPFNIRALEYLFDKYDVIVSLLISENVTIVTIKEEHCDVKESVIEIVADTTVELLNKIYDMLDDIVNDFKNGKRNLVIILDKDSEIVEEYNSVKHIDNVDFKVETECAFCNQNFKDYMIENTQSIKTIVTSINYYTEINNQEILAYIKTILLLKDNTRKAVNIYCDHTETEEFNYEDLKYRE